MHLIPMFWMLTNEQAENSHQSTAVFYKSLYHTSLLFIGLCNSVLLMPQMSWTATCTKRLVTRP